MQPFPALILGNPEHPPLVFLHGFLGQDSDWLPVAKAFSDSFYCILPDLPGHGKNTHLSFDLPLSYDVLAEGLLATLVNSNPINLVGYSMGGRTALYFALQYPERVKKLVLESTNPGIKDENARSERAQLDDRWAHDILNHGMEIFIDAWYDLPLFRSLHHQPKLLEHIKATRRHNSPEWMAKVIAELSPGRQPWLGNQLGKLTMPVLLLAGALDKKYASILDNFAGAIPHSHAVVIPDAGHTIHAEQQEAFTEALLGYLTQRSSVPPDITRTDTPKTPR